MHILSIDISPIFVFAKSQIISPAGILTKTALLKDSLVLLTDNGFGMTPLEFAEMQEDDQIIEEIQKEMKRRAEN